MNLSKFIATAIAATLLSIGSSANAITMVAGQAFEDDAFADVVLSSFGTFGPTLLVPTAGFPEDALGSNVDTFAASVTGGAFIELGFVDNKIVNLPGVDVGIFELGSLTEPQFFSLSLGGPTAVANTTDTGFDTINGQNINFGAFDLSDLGVPVGGTVSNLFVFTFCDAVAAGIGFCTEGDQVVSAVAVVAALNSISVPEPASLILFAAGVLALVLTRRRWTQMG